MRKPLYITTTLPYVNADPHIGFALEIVHADIFARYRILQGDDVFFNTGTDEHGLKIFRKATEEGKTAQIYVDEYAVKFRSLKEVLNLYPDLHFIRTTDPHHVAAAQEIWRRCAQNGDIYKKKYKGLYCVGDEMFLKEGDLINGKCPNHPTMEPMEIEEENYFFRLSAYQEKLISYLSDPKVILPDWRRQEAIRFVEQGLEDFSVSRERRRLSWGIPVPDDDTQTMYVWFDALTNYISTLGWPHDGEGLFKKFWEEGETLQLAGKDQVRFQSIMWQAMLMSAGLPTTQQIVYHGFITSGGQKMSKSLGNVIDPLSIVAEYGTDALRYFLARHVHPFEDTDVTMEKFKEVYNADLANGLGNLVSRIAKMQIMFISDSFVPRINSAQAFETFPDIKSFIEKFELNRALDEIWKHISSLDLRIQNKQPFRFAGQENLKGKIAKQEIRDLVSRLYTLSFLIESILPGTSREIQKLLTTPDRISALFPRKE